MFMIIESVMLCLCSYFEPVMFIRYVDECFSNIDAAYTDFFNKLLQVINEIAPSKKTRIKNNNQDWFDEEVPDLIHVREELFLFQKSKLYIDGKIYKKISNNFQKLIKKRSEISIKLTLSKKINRPREL